MHYAEKNQDRYIVKSREKKELQDKLGNNTYRVKFSLESTFL